MTLPAVLASGRGAFIILTNHETSLRVFGVRSRASGHFATVDCYCSNPAIEASRATLSHEIVTFALQRIRNDIHE